MKFNVVATDHIGPIRSGKRSRVYVSSCGQFRIFQVYYRRQGYEKAGYAWTLVNFALPKQHRVCEGFGTLRQAKNQANRSKHP